ncbi:MAG: PDZ domain-containing protein [Lachnospiraceae bacterium]|nr:PDZ domain-containing protein [Lachnospiraceae bacterium]
MTQENGDNKDNYKFIEEKIVQNKSKKVRKAFSKIFTSILCGLAFGVSAVGAFYFLGERILPKEKEEVPVIENQPQPGYTDIIIDPEADKEKDKDGETGEEKDDEEKNSEEEPKHIITSQPVIVQNRIRADLSDFSAIHRQINDMAMEVNKSIVKVAVVERELDWFQNPYETRELTSGFIAKEDESFYYIITGSDKVMEKEDIRVSFNGSPEVPAEVYDMQSEVGLACLRVDSGLLDADVKKDISVSAIGESYSLFVGEPIVALGNPNGTVYSMLIGCVSDKNGVANVVDDRIDLFGTDIKTGTDGSGIIVNMDGSIIGIITKKLSTNKEVCMAMSISRIQNLIEKMVTKTPRVYLGVVTTDLTDEMKKGLTQNGGIYVSKVEAGSPAAESGLKAGDVILQIGDNAVFTTAGFSTYLQSFEAGSAVTVKVARPDREGEEVLSLDITLGEAVLK